MLKFFRRKATEIDLFLAVMRAAAIALAKQINSGNLTRDDEIAGFVTYCFEERKVKPSDRQKNTAALMVDCLLVEGDFISEIVRKMSNNTLRIIEEDYLRVKQICQENVSKFMEHTRTSYSN